MDKGGKRMSEKVRLGLSGLGNFSTTIANAVKRSPRAELVTCFDVLPERRQAAAAKYGCGQESSFEAMIRRKDIDGVLLVTPNALHCGQTEMAVKYRKHVYVEKPIANTLSDGKRMIEVCQKAGVILMIGHVHRRHAGNRKIKELIDNGAIGKPVMVETNLSSRRGWELTPDEFRWRGDDSGSPGGAIMQYGIHQADTLNYIFGPVKTAFSFSKKLHIPAPVEDVTTTILAFESGILGYLGCSFAAPRTNWMYVYGTEANLLRTSARPDRPIKEYLKSSDSVDQFTRLEIFEKGRDTPREIPLLSGNPIQEEIDEFAECILTGKNPETDGQVGLTALALVRAAIESARAKKPIEIAV
jgi:predicted dehydrogenase